MTIMLQRVLLIALLAIAGMPARAADYPVRPVSFIVPYAAGGATDLMARLLGQRLEQRLGKPFVVENRPGAGTVLAAAYVSKQPPDGYTLLLGTSTTMAITLPIYKSLPYDPTPHPGPGPPRPRPPRCTPGMNGTRGPPATRTSS